MNESLDILIIDDSKTSRRLLQTYAEATDYEIAVTEAADGREGLAQVQARSFHCIFLDYVLPDLDGLQVLRQIKQLGIGTPVIVLTGQGSEPIAVEMMKAGAADYVPKSELTPEVLYRCLHTSVQLQEAESRSRQANETMLQAKQEAEEAYRAHSEFFARMSHEIRTPLNVILGTTELLRATELEDDQLNLVQTCQRAGNMLMVLINDILDMSKVQSGELDLKKVDFDLKETFENVCSMMAVQAQGKKLEFNYRFDDGLPSIVQGDPDRLTQILVNLTGNAIKFTPRGEVRVVATKDPDNPQPGVIRFCVLDTGIGIPKDRQDLIFSSYHQGDSSVSQVYGGTGLGLAITQTLVEKMNGRIWVDSEKGQGSKFYFTIQVEPMAPANVARKGLSDTQLGLDPASLPTPDGRPIRILVAEDTFDNRLLLKSFLKRAPVDLTFAYNGRDACERFSNNEFDLILMDMEMPELNGFQATRNIREMERLAGVSADEQIPIIALTAHSFVEEKDQCFEAGCSDFLMKPFKRATLLGKIHQHTKTW